MAVDIKDLVISADILEAPQGGSAPGEPDQGAQDGGGRPPVEDLVAACVAEVLRILRREAMR